MGILVGFFAHNYTGGGQNLRLFLTTGILGGFTTFSAFSLDVVLLWERGEALGAFVYVLLSLVLSIGALLVGLLIMRAVA